MKKRFVCVAMVVILIGLSVMIWPVSAENQTSTSDSGFTLSVTKMIMAVGDVTYIDVTPIDVEPTWTSNNESVVSIDAHTGVLTALKLGSATITAT